MKISISKSILENILIHSQAFLEKKDSSQINSHLLLKSDSISLIVKATDYEIGLETKTDQVSVDDIGQATANGKKLLDIVKNLRDENVNLETKSNDLLIYQGTTNFKLPMFDAKEFPAFPFEKTLPNINIDTNILINSLKKITPSTDSNNPKFELNGACIDIKKDTINFVSTDTRRLAIINFDNNTEDELELIVPKKAIIEIQKLFLDNTNISYDETHLIITSDHFKFFTKLINGKFPDYSRIIPKTLAKKIFAPKRLFTDCIKQISTISTDMKITFDVDKIVFESLSDDSNEAVTEAIFDTNLNEKFSIAVNSRYILDFISQIDEESLNLEFNEPNQPFVISSNNFKTIVMPIVI